MIDLDDDTRERLDRHARETGKSASDLVRTWLLERLHRIDMLRRTENFASLSEQERIELRDWAGDQATDAQLLWLDAEDGGYDWGPDGPPTADRPIEEKI